MVHSYVSGLGWQRRPQTGSWQKDEAHELVVGYIPPYITFLYWSTEDKTTSNPWIAPFCGAKAPPKEPVSGPWGWPGPLVLLRSNTHGPLWVDCLAE